jgi:alpha-galactosidase
MFGHLGIEWDITSLTDDERTQLRHGVALHRRFRPLIHSGKVVRFDVAANGATPCGVAHGVVSEHDDEALLCYAQLATGASLVPPTLRLPGFDHKRRYRLAHVPLPGATLEWAGDGAVVRGDTLERFGVQLPMMFPESAMLVHITEAD